MTILIFLAVLFVLILVHEWGHFITAKKTGMQVDEFGIGFPPRLVAKRMGETEYTLNLLPIGGFVRIVGENAEDIAKGEEGSSNPRSFVHKPKWAQALVLVAGVAMNVIFAWLLYVVVFMVGVPTVVDEQMATDAAVLTVTSVLPGSPAADAGLVVGAEVTGVVRGEDTLDTLTPGRLRPTRSAATPCSTTSVPSSSVSSIRATCGWPTRAAGRWGAIHVRRSRSRRA